MPKLKMKRTPAEERERDIRKARKAAKKAARGCVDHDASSHSADDGPFWDSQDEADRASRSHSRKRRKTESYSHHATRASTSDEEYGPQPAHFSPVDPERILREMEERRFREKMLDAVDDEGYGYGNSRLDELEAHLNSYQHIPRRWQPSSSNASMAMDDDCHMQADPNQMEDEEYAEWIRAGMWRRKHGAEYEAEQERMRAQEERRRKEEQLRRETRRLERQAREERRRRKERKSIRRWAEYEEIWEGVLEGDGKHSSMAFTDVPWPISTKGPDMSEEDLTPDGISVFLFSGLGMSETVEDTAKQKRDRIRATLLRFHPDKFEGRVMRHVQEQERTRVREAVGQVARALNTLLANSGT
jgi:hypothetical protein